MAHNASISSTTPYYDDYYNENNNDDKERRWIAFTLVLLVRAVMLVHSATDICCVACVLWPDDVTRWLGQHPWLDWFAELYSSVFAEQEDREHGVLRRVTAYWVMSMSVVRLFAIVEPSFSLLTCVALMYLLEAFAFEFEAAEAVVLQRTGRLVRVASTVMASVVFLTAVLLPRT